MWERFTQAAKYWVGYAQQEAVRHETNKVSPEHFLLALLREGGDDPALAIVKLLVPDREALVQAIEWELAQAQSVVWPPPPQDEPIMLTDGAVQSLQLASVEAARRERKEISPSYLLLGFIRANAFIDGRLLACHGLTLDAVRKAVAEQEGNELGLAANKNWWTALVSRK